MPQTAGTRTIGQVAVRQYVAEFELLQYECYLLEQQAASAVAGVVEDRRALYALAPDFARIAKRFRTLHALFQNVSAWGSWAAADAEAIRLRAATAAILESIEKITEKFGYPMEDGHAPEDYESVMERARQYKAALAGSALEKARLRTEVGHGDTIGPAERHFHGTPSDPVTSLLQIVALVRTAIVMLTGWKK
jgi:hypothetical protein